MSHFDTKNTTIVAIVSSLRAYAPGNLIENVSALFVSRFCRNMLSFVCVNDRMNGLI
jgi:hypothetical protein